MTSPRMPWATTLDMLRGHRCRAVLEPDPGHAKWADFGRCELRRHDRNTDHALERGMYDVRWSTRETDGSGVLLGSKTVTKIRQGQPITGRALTGVVVLTYPVAGFDAGYITNVVLPRMAPGALLRLQALEA